MTRSCFSRLSLGLLACFGLSLLPGAARAELVTISNPTTILIPGSGTIGTANPYPSTIVVSGVAGSITSLSLTLNGFSHTFTADVGVLLVAPGGAVGAVVFEGGSSATSTNLNLTFQDGGALWPASGPISSGTYQPRFYDPDVAFSAPAPLIAGANPTPNVAGPSSFSVFNGLDPNGTWSLFVQDFATADTGQIAEGWTLNITTDAVAGAPEPASLALFGLGALGLLGYARRHRRPA